MSANQRERSAAHHAERHPIPRAALDQIVAALASGVSHLLLGDEQAT